MMDPHEAYWDHVERSRQLMMTIGATEREIAGLDTRAGSPSLAATEVVKLSDKLWATKARLDALKAHAEREVQALARFQEKNWGYTFEGQRPYGQKCRYPDAWTAD